MMQRECFSSEELATCLRHYDIGKVQKVGEFVRGSQRAPKVVIETDKGKYLLKRRAGGKKDRAKVEFTHAIQRKLTKQNFPLPHLIATQEDQSTLLVLAEHIYEMFEYICGGNYDGSLNATYHAGHILGLYHKLLADFQSDFKPPRGSYHNAKTIRRAIRTTVGSLPLDTRPNPEVLTQTVGMLEEAYKNCCEKVDDLGLSDWPKQIVHGDWHPGNMLFAKRRVVAVIDYDAARLQQRVIDVANGALQFSILGGGDDPSQWPEYVDETRFKRFLRGYDAVNVLSKREIRAVPYLISEAMIAEGVLPIATTGSFGRMEGFSFLQMMQRKVTWILSHIDELCGVIED